MPHSFEYEEALKFEQEQIRVKLKSKRARYAARELFGGTPEQQEETYKQLMGEDYV